MAEDRGWPDPSEPCVPHNPERAGPHLIVDEYGRRRWAWWMPTRRGGRGIWLYVHGGGRGECWSYVGPARTPDDRPVD
jgi:hypothetical protein